jgi:MscS family membrane protein
VGIGAIFLFMLHGPFLRKPVYLSKANRNWRRVFLNVVAIGTLYLIYWFLAYKINLTGSVLLVVTNCLTLAYWYFLATSVLFLSNAIAETVVASPKIDPEGIQASYIRAVFGLFGLIAMALLMLTGLFKVGVSLGPLLAGAGIGGLAVALAARPTFENVISSFMIFLDKPYRVGQRVKVMGQDGTIESIGLRSTKIRLLTGHLTSIPNQQMANAEVENIGRRPYIRRLLNITITYDTPPEKINQAVNILKEILSVPNTPESESTNASGAIEKIAEIESQKDPHPNEAINQPDFPPRVYFNDLNADSLNILVIYWYHPPEYWEYLDHAHWVNVQIMERFNAEGIDFAFPTQTLHLAGDEKRPIEVEQQKLFADDTISERT